MRDKDMITQNSNWFRACMQTIQQQAFYNMYWKAFDVIEARSEADIDTALRLRYEVYCRENAFVDARNCKDGRERDEFDDHAVHHLMIHKESGRAVGTVRVLLPQENHPLTSFEMQKVCDHPLLQIENRAMGLAEISRMCMIRDFRRRPRDGHILPSYYEQEWSAGEKNTIMPIFRRRIPFAPLGLMMAAWETVLNAGLLDCVSAVDPGQFRTLKRIGLTYRVLGPRVAYMGSQQPFIYNIKTALDTMAAQNKECWDIVSDRGRLHERANELQKNHWQDEIFDDVCKEMIMSKLI